MSCFHVSTWLRVCSSLALSRLRALFSVRAWCSDPGTHVLCFGFVSGVRTLALHFLSCCVSMRSQVCLSVRSSVHVCCVLRCCMQFMFLSCIHAMSCAVWHAAYVFHWLRAFMLSCLNTWLMSILISCSPRPVAH